MTSPRIKLLLLASAWDACKFDAAQARKQRRSEVDRESQQNGREALSEQQTQETVQP